MILDLTESYSLLVARIKKQDFCNEKIVRNNQRTSVMHPFWRVLFRSFSNSRAALGKDHSTDRTSAPGLQLELAGSSPGYPAKLLANTSHIPSKDLV